MKFRSTPNIYYTEITFSISSKDKLSTEQKLALYKLHSLVHNIKSLSDKLTKVHTMMQLELDHIIRRNYCFTMKDVKEVSPWGMFDDEMYFIIHLTGYDDPCVGLFLDIIEAECDNLVNVAFTSECPMTREFITSDKDYEFSDGDMNLLCLQLNRNIPEESELIDKYFDKVDKDKDVSLYERGNDIYLTRMLSCLSSNINSYEDIPKEIKDIIVPIKVVNNDDYR